MSKPLPRMLKVSGSETIAAIGYSWARTELAVQFKQSPEVVYTYKGVMPMQFVEMCEAPSIGSFFQQKIRRSYAHEKHELKQVETPQAEAAKACKDCGALAGEKHDMTKHAEEKEVREAALMEPPKITLPAKKPIKKATFAGAQRKTAKP